MRFDDGFNDFFNAYVEAALWSSTDDDGFRRPVTIDDIARASLSEMRRDAKAFYRYLKTVAGYNGSMSQAGCDFWLTRNRHGAGFWDRGLGAIGDELTKEAHAYGESNLYVGDRGKVHVA